MTTNISTDQNRIEANADSACTWFPDIGEYPEADRVVGICTPLGWKDHALRFNVLNDGSVGPTWGLQEIDYSARTHPEYDSKRVRIIPSCGSNTAAETPQKADMQGWADGIAPVLWTQWVRDGIAYRSEVMAHLLGGGVAAAGQEPLFAWLRLSVQGGENADTGFILSARVHALVDSMDDAEVPAGGWRLVVRGRVVLGILPDQKARMSVAYNKEEQRLTLRIKPYASTGGSANVDLLFPARPVVAEVYEDEAAIGFERAVDEARRSWSEASSTAAVIDTPEPFVNNALAKSIMFNEIIATRDPQTQEHCMISGAMWYHASYAAADCLRRIWLLEAFGHFEMSEKYLRVHQREQGLRTPYGSMYPRHPGYLSDSSFAGTSGCWITSHGGILYNIAEHALLRGDEAFVSKYIDTIIKACEFIKDARAYKHDGIPGLLPPARSTDFDPGAQDAFSSGFTYKGLITAVRLLGKIGHARAQEFADEAEDYRQAIVGALRSATERLPPWQDPQGRDMPSVPNMFYPEEKSAKRMMDCAAHLLVFAEVLPADDPLMQASLASFREGGPGEGCFARHLGEVYQHEVCVTEPVYSWNLFCSHATADRDRFLEGLYGMLACGVSRNTYISSEGSSCSWVNDNLFTISTVALMVRLAVVDDRIQPDELHLLRLCPLAWISPNHLTRFERMPTYFGTVTLKFKLSADRKTFEVEYATDFREPPKSVVLHIPPIEGLTQVTVNGEPQDVEDGKIHIGGISH